MGTIPSKKERPNFLSVSHPVIVILFLSFTLSLLILLPSLIFDGDKSVFNIQENNLFAQIEEIEDLSYCILSRKNLDRKGYHNIYLEIQVSGQVTKEKLVALSQKIVKDVITHEKCFSIPLDYGKYGFADFAPQNILTRLSKIPEDSYQNYRFKYVFLD